LAVEDVKPCNNNDLIIYDRNYASYRFLATHLNKANFLIRCSKSSFKAARDLFEKNVVKSCITTIKAPETPKIKSENLPVEDKVF